MIITAEISIEASDNDFSTAAAYRSSCKSQESTSWSVGCNTHLANPFSHVSDAPHNYAVGVLEKNQQNSS